MQYSAAVYTRAKVFCVNNEVGDIWEAFVVGLITSRIYFNADTYNTLKIPSTDPHQRQQTKLDNPGIEISASKFCSTWDQTYQMFLNWVHCRINFNFKPNLRRPQQEQHFKVFFTFLFFKLRRGHSTDCVLEVFLNCAFIWDTSSIINEKSWKLKEIFESFLPLLSKTNFPQLIYDDFKLIFLVHTFGSFSHFSLKYLCQLVTKVNCF